MPWCPECGTEYRAGFSVCKDCHISLTETPPEEKIELSNTAQVRETLLTIVRDEMEFTRIESLMAEAKIPVLKKHHGSGEYLEIYMGATPYGIEVYVPYEAYSRAKALLSGDESVLEGIGEISGQEPVMPDPEDIDSGGREVLDAHEEQELQRYMSAVNLDMNQKKKAIAMMMLLSMGAGVIWTVYSLVKELF